MPADSSNSPIPPASAGGGVDSGLSVADLKLVDEAGHFADRVEEEEFESGATGTTTDESTSRGLPIWMFLVGLVLAVAVIGWQVQRAGRLEAEIASLKSDLERSHALVEAHRSHLGEIRGGVYDLSERLDDLRALVEAGPEVDLTGSAPQTPTTP